MFQAKISSDHEYTAHVLIITDLFPSEKNLGVVIVLVAYESDKILCPK